MPKLFLMKPSALVAIKAGLPNLEEQGFLALGFVYRE